MMKFLALIMVLLSNVAYACDDCDPHGGGIAVGAAALSTAESAASASANQSQGQSQSLSTSNNQAVSVTNNNTSRTVGGGTTRYSVPRQVATAYAGASNSFSQASCKPIVGGGVQTPFGGASITTTVTDENCEGVVAAQAYQSLGLPSVACNRMAIATDKNARALAMSGVNCNTAYIQRETVTVSTPALDEYDRKKRDMLFKEKMSK